jgi:hypothetical protein
MADLLVFVKLSSLQTGVLAQARACATDSATGRPVIGLIEINQLSLDPANIDFKQIYYVLLHEFHHIIAFSTLLFQAPQGPPPNFYVNVTSPITG